MLRVLCPKRALAYARTTHATKKPAKLVKFRDICKFYEKKFILSPLFDYFIHDLKDFSFGVGTEECDTSLAEITQTFEGG